jgi:hypothetical protein
MKNYVFFETFIDLGINQLIIYQFVSKHFSASGTLWMWLIKYRAAAAIIKKMYPFEFFYYSSS